MGIPPMPDSATFLEWRRTVFSICCAASGRGEQTATWLSACAVPEAQPRDFVVVKPQWRSFDSKLANAIRAVLHGDLLTRVNTMLDVSLLGGRMLSGRATLCAVFREFRPTGRNFTCDSLMDVYDHRISGSTLEDLQAYCSTLDALVLRCLGEQPSEEVLGCKFYNQVKGFSALSFDIEGYDRMRDDDPNRTYRWLRLAVDRVLDIWRADQHRLVYTASLRSTRRSRRVPAKTPSQTPLPAAMCTSFQSTGWCRFGAHCSYAHAGKKHFTGPRNRPAAPAAPAAVPEIRAVDTEVQSGKRALRRAAAAAATSAAERAATEAPDEPPVDNRHLYCRYALLATGCSRGEACCFAHGPMGTLTVAAYTASRAEINSRGAIGATAITAMYLSVRVNRPTSGPGPVVSALASLHRDGVSGSGRRICFQLSDEVFLIEATGRQLGREHYRSTAKPGTHVHSERRRASATNNLASSARAIQSAWNLAWEAGSATDEQLPSGVNSSRRWSRALSA